MATTLGFTATFPHEKTINDLEDQMNRSARSVKANIVEGWKRNATYEYYTFLGYAIASNAELLEDYLDICLGRYEEKGIKGEMREKGREKLESLRFYPLDSRLPHSVQLYLRAKELNMLLSKLQQSLFERMHEKKTLSQADRSRLAAEARTKKNEADEREFEEWLERESKVWTTSGIVSKDEARARGLPLIKGEL